MAVSRKYHRRATEDHSAPCPSFFAVESLTTAATGLGVRGGGRPTVEEIATVRGRRDASRTGKGDIWWRRRESNLPKRSREFPLRDAYLGDDAAGSFGEVEAGRVHQVPSRTGVRCRVGGNLAASVTRHPKSPQ